MPADRLTGAAATRAPDIPALQPDTDAVCDGVLAVLGGAPLDAVAVGLGIAAEDLADAIDTYRQAGRTALNVQASTRDWYQVHVEFRDWTALERIAVTTLGPMLRDLQDEGDIAGWWYIRKYPDWRLRVKPGKGAAPTDTKAAIDTVLGTLDADGVILRWRETFYEPETASFGSRTGMDIAHELFCADSDSILTYLRQPDPVIGRDQLSVLLCTTMFRAARQEWRECGDVWHRVAQERPRLDEADVEGYAEVVDTLREKFTNDVRPTGALFGADGPLAFAAPWAAAFDKAGRALAVAADEGALRQGTREVLMLLVIFHWNRLGLSTMAQIILSNAARSAILG